MQGAQDERPGSLKGIWKRSEGKSEIKAPTTSKYKSNIDNIDSILILFNDSPVWRASFTEISTCLLKILILAEYKVEFSLLNSL